MATPEEEIKDLKEKNNELVQKVQHWKMTAAQRENEKFTLIKEINELRLKLNRLRNSGGVQARNLDTAIQAASERALAHLVRASGEIAHTIDLAKAYMRDRQELDNASPRWSTISGSPASERRERVHRVPPMMIGGQSIQPVVALSRTLMNTNSSRSSPSSPNQNRRITGRAVPMHMLQDVYIPLTRIDIGDRLSNNMDTETEPQTTEDTTEHLALNDSVERVLDESQNVSEDDEFESSRRLDAVTEDLEPEDEVETPPRNRIDNPLEGPSWLLDTPTEPKSPAPKPRVDLEPDSTTEVEEKPYAAAEYHRAGPAGGQGARPSRVFSPTVRRRKRTASPPPSPADTPRHSPRPLSARRHSNDGRVLKVMVAKMRLESDNDDSEDGTSPPKRPAVEPSPPPSPAAGGEAAGSVMDEDTTRSPEASPPQPAAVEATPPAGRSRAATPHKKHMRFDAPSPNGTTDAGVLVFETGGPAAAVPRGRRPSRPASASSDSDSGGAGDPAAEGRSRRHRKAVTYKEKPLNVKLRR